MFTYNLKPLGKNANIFISHSGLDKELAAAIESYLFEGLKIALENIFRFSRVNNIPTGEKFHDFILGAIKEADIAIFLITVNSVSSRYCYYEMGACWALGIKPFIIYFDPISVSDDIFKNLPFTQVQSSNINFDNKNSIYNMLESLRSIIYGDTFDPAEIYLHKEKFIKRICNNMLDSFKLNLQDGIVFVHDSYNENVLKIKEVSKDSIKLCIDYTELRPKYAGYAVRLHDTSWSSYFKDNYVFSISYIPQKGLKSFYIEFKGKDKKMIGRKLINISESDYGNNINVQIILKDININSIYWKNMSEIVFLFLGEFEESPSVLCINNVYFKKSEEM